MVYSLSGICISFQEMTLSLKSPGYENPIHASFKSAKHIEVIEFPGTGQSNDLYIGWIGKPHHPSQISGGEGAVMAGKGQHIRFPFSRYVPRFFYRGAKILDGLHGLFSHV
jgi:hypothetical protein